LLQGKGSFCGRQDFGQGTEVIITVGDSESETT
jgi:hypothetical protein